MARKKQEKQPGYSDDEKIVQEARERFKRCEEYESIWRERFRDDVKFYDGDPDNGYQWPAEVRKNRQLEQKPMLTINKTRQFCLNITNDSRQNKPSIKVRPTGQQASYDGAQVMEGLVRAIEYHSNAQDIYNAANVSQVKGGAGVWRVVTNYAAPDSFDQEIYIKRIRDPLSVFIDPDALELDKSDARFCFIFEDMPRDQFDVEYPDFQGSMGSSALLQDNNWLDDKHVRVCEYYRRYQKKTNLYLLQDPETGEQTTITQDKMPPELVKAAKADPTTKVREIVDYEVQWFKIAGDQVIERSIWAGTTIPVVMIVGEESVIEGKLDRKGHVRFLKDPQRIYNYWSSSSVEFVALQSKSPFIGAARAIQGYETYWRTANTANHSILPYNDLDDKGQPIPPPQRQNPPVMSQAFMDGMKIAAEEMRMASGQYQADTGEPGNEISGRAIQQRQRQGDNATYHFIDNQSMGIRYTGRIIMELIPKIYDTSRVLKIMGLDGTETAVRIHPDMQQEIIKEADETSAKASIIFNPNFGKYSVEADIGPAYATRRQEAFDALTKIIGGNPELLKLAGDLLFSAADFPMADKLAERLRRAVPSALLGHGPSPEVQQLTMQLQAAQKHIEGLVVELADKSGKSDVDEAKIKIDEYRAETDRIKATLDKINPDDIARLVSQMMLDSMNTRFADIEQKIEASQKQAPQQPSPLDSALLAALNQGQQSQPQ